MATLPNCCWWQLAVTGWWVRRTVGWLLVEVLGEQTDEIVWSRMASFWLTTSHWDNCGEER